MCGWGLYGGGLDRIVDSVGVTTHASLNEHMGVSVV